MAGSNLGGTIYILIATAAACLVGLALTRHWRPVIYLVVVMLGELAMFLLVEVIVKRPRPDVPHLDSRLPTSAFPSGHMAAATCLYVGIAILVIGHARGWWRYLILVPAVVIPAAVALARMYRGEHHPTDILASAPQGSGRRTGNSTDRSLSDRPGSLSAGGRESRWCRRSRR